MKRIKKESTLWCSTGRGRHGETYRDYEEQPRGTRGHYIRSYAHTHTLTRLWWFSDSIFCSAVSCAFTIIYSRLWPASPSSVLCPTTMTPHRNLDRTWSVTVERPTEASGLRLRSTLIKAFWGMQLGVGNIPPWYILHTRLHRYHREKPFIHEFGNWDKIIISSQTPSSNEMRLGLDAVLFFLWQWWQPGTFGAPRPPSSLSERFDTGFFPLGGVSH